MESCYNCRWEGEIYPCNNCCHNNNDVENSKWAPKLSNKIPLIGVEK